MNTNDKPFAALDKLLFSSAQVAQQPQKQEKGKQSNKETRKQPKKKTILPTSQKPSLETKKRPSRRVAFEPDVPQKHRLYRKQTFEFSKEELDFLEKAKFHLRELGVTKNEIVRTALELLNKDYQANKETSFLVRKFSGQPARKVVR